MTFHAIPPARSSADPRIAKVISFVNHAPHLRRRDLAGLVNLSVWHLVRLFKKETGMQMNQYLQQRRLQNAAQLLLTSNDSIKMISFKCGYQHSSSFVRAFIQRFGQSPQAYRQKQALACQEARLDIPA